MAEPQQLTEQQRKELEEKLKNMSPEEIKELQKQQCIFCQIISGKVAGYKVYEDDKTVAILDIHPANQGHVLLMQKEHYTVMPQMPKEDVGPFFTIAKNISNVLLRALRVEGTNIFIANGVAAGQKGPHFMVHIIPRVTDDNILNVLPKKLDKDVLREMYPLLVNKMNQLMGVKKEVINVPEEKEIVQEEQAAATQAGEESAEEGEIEEEAKEDEGAEEETKEPESSEEGGVDLDDISRLFQ